MIYMRMETPSDDIMGRVALLTEGAVRTAFRQASARAGSAMKQELSNQAQKRLTLRAAERDIKAYARWELVEAKANHAGGVDLVIKHKPIKLHRYAVKPVDYRKRGSAYHDRHIAGEIIRGRPFTTKKFFAIHPGPNSKKWIFVKRDQHTERRPTKRSDGVYSAPFPVHMLYGMSIAQFLEVTPGARDAILKVGGKMIKERFAYEVRRRLAKQILRSPTSYSIQQVDESIRIIHRAANT